MQHFSIKFRLSLAFYLFLFLVLFMGIFSISCLRNFSAVADEIRDRWLLDIRFLGDLNNYTSDFRAAEGTLLLSVDTADIAASEQEMDQLDRNIAAAMRNYERIYHDPKEYNLYNHFVESWLLYRNMARQVFAKVKSGHKEEGARFYKTSSNTAYDAASDLLGELTDIDVAYAKQASSEAAATYNKVQFLMWLVMATGIFIVIVGVIYIRRHISAPMLTLAEAMQRLSHNDMHIEIEDRSRRDEIGEMARAIEVFRNNAIELALGRQALIKQASMLEEKLEHERRLIAMQSNFISTTSHEFRTPLNIIDGHAQRLAKLKENATLADVQERAAKIRGAVAQITGLIDSLINASRLMDADPELYFHPQKVGMADLLHGVCVKHKEIVSDIQIHETISGAPMEITGDPKLLEQMIGNLLSNAIKYSTNDSNIEVTAANDSGHIIITVQDHGIGIPPKDMEGIFERYVRGSNASDIPGTGIGLYLAKIIVQLHRGRIIAESTEGKGSKFTVCLPT